MITTQMPKVKVHFSLVLYTFICLFTGFIKDFSIIILILLFHELGHIIFIKVFKGKIKCINLSLIGGLMDIETENKSLIQALLINFGRPY